MIHRQADFTSAISAAAGMTPSRPRRHWLRWPGDECDAGQRRVGLARMGEPDHESDREKNYQ